MFDPLSLIPDMQLFRTKAKEVLEVPMPANLIKERDGGGGMKLSYVGGATVIRKLNFAFDNLWDWSVTSFQIIPSEPKKITKKWNNTTRRMDTLAVPIIEEQPPIAHVVGTLTVPGFGARVGFGSKVVIGGASEQESCFKSAATDALKKASTLFGIALELYEDEPTYFEEDFLYMKEQAGEAVTVPNVATPVAVEEKVKPKAADKKVADKVVEKKATEFTKKPDAMPERKTIVIEKQEEPKAPATTEELKAFDLLQFQKIQGLAAELGLTGSGPLSYYIAEMTEGKKTMWSQLNTEDLPQLKEYLEKLVNELKVYMEKLAIVDLPGFNAYIRDFSDNVITEFKDLNPTHLRSFMIYLEKKIENK